MRQFLDALQKGQTLILFTLRPIISLFAEPGEIGGFPLMRMTPLRDIL